MEASRQELMEIRLGRVDGGEGRCGDIPSKMRDLRGARDAYVVGCRSVRAIDTQSMAFYRRYVSMNRQTSTRLTRYGISFKLEHYTDHVGILIGPEPARHGCARPILLHSDLCKIHFATSTTPQPLHLRPSNLVHPHTFAPSSKCRK